MDILAVERAYGKFGLKKATIIIGVLNIFLSTVGIILLIDFLISIVDDSDFSRVMFEAIKKKLKLDGVVSSSDAEMVIYIVWTLFMSISVLYTLFASLLVHGARTDHPGLLTPWLVLTAICMGNNILNIITSLAQHLWSIVFFNISLLVIEAHLFVCVYLFRKQLQKGGTSYSHMKSKKIQIESLVNV